MTGVGSGKDHSPRTSLALRPECSKGHGFMDLRESSTPEQAWCGTWYDCATAWCRNSFLLPSPELTTSLGGES